MKKFSNKRLNESQFSRTPKSKDGEIEALERLRDKLQETRKGESSMKDDSLIHDLHDDLFAFMTEMAGEKLKTEINFEHANGWMVSKLEIRNGGDNVIFEVDVIYDMLGEQHITVETPLTMNSSPDEDIIKIVKAINERKER